MRRPPSDYVLRPAEPSIEAHGGWARNREGTPAGIVGWCSVPDPSAASETGIGSGSDQTFVHDITDILRILPHRYPFLLVDRILEVDPGKRIVGLKNVTFNEQFFQGHFPGAPVMPGVLILESMAQVAGVLIYRDLPEPGKKLIYFTGVENAKFRRP